MIASTKERPARLGILRLAPLFLTAAIAGCGTGAPPSDIGDAQTAFADRDFRTARIHLLNILGETPDSDAANLLYARTMLALGDGIAAQAAVAKISDTGIDAASRAALRAHGDIVRGLPQQAIDRIEAIDPDQRGGQGYRMLLWGHMENDSIDDHPELFAEALERHDDNADIHALVGRHAVNLGDWDIVREAMQAALDRDAGNYEALLLKAEVEIHDDDLEAARSTYADLAKRFPNHAVPLANIAGLEIDAGNYDAAAQVITDAETQHPGFAFLQFQKARLANAQGDYRRANDILQAMPDYIHDYPPGLALSAEIAEKLDNREIAIARLERLLAIVPDDDAAREKLETLQL
ncbi:MAG: tetratricopeptide repeat protein [Pseudomonadota bacterium]